MTSRAAWALQSTIKLPLGPGVQRCARCAKAGAAADNEGEKEEYMPARPTWKGYLKISLVNIPVRVFPATDSAATVSFNQLHAECQTRIQQKRWCPSCEREVPHSEIVKGYEFEKGRYVVMGEEDIAKVRPESTRVIDLVQFTDAAAIDPIYVERPYYLAPDGAMATQAFAVMREGMKGKAGIGKLALYGREYLVAVQPKDNGLVMYTMRHAKEVRSMGEIEELGRVPDKVKPEEIKLAKQVIENFEGALDLTEYRDEYQEELQRIIDAKIAGEEVVATAEEAPPKVVNLMDALRQSLDRVSTGKKKTAKVEAAKPARAAKAKEKKRAAR
jgi:DNA end-binding protein Ku